MTRAPVAVVLERSSARASHDKAMNGESKDASTDASGRNVYIRFRLSNLDVVQSDEPVSPWRFVHASPFYAPEPLRSVPVIRIYGATDKGQRVVAHARGCFPYLYCNYEGSLDPDSGALRFLSVVCCWASF